MYSRVIANSGTIIISPINGRKRERRFNIDARTAANGTSRRDNRNRLRNNRIALVTFSEFSESSHRSKQCRLNTRDNAVFIINRIHDPQPETAAEGWRRFEQRSVDSGSKISVSSPLPECRYHPRISSYVSRLPGANAGHAR